MTKKLVGKSYDYTFIKNINIETLIYLFDYQRAKPIYLDFFNDVTNYAHKNINLDRILDLAGNKINLGLGGLHSKEEVSLNSK